MKVVSSITNQPKQTFNVTLDDNSVVIFNLYYLMTQEAWYFDFQYNDYKSNGNKVVLTLNAIRHLRDRLPFGIGFISESNADPFDLNDFQNNKVFMTILNSEEVEEIEESVYSAE